MKNRISSLQAIKRPFRPDFQPPYQLPPIMKLYSTRTTSKTAAFKTTFTFCLVPARINQHRPIFRCCLCTADRMLSLHVFLQTTFLQGIFSLTTFVRSNYKAAAAEQRGTASCSGQKLNRHSLTCWETASCRMHCSRCGKVTFHPSAQIFSHFYKKL